MCGWGMKFGVGRKRTIKSKMRAGVGGNLQNGNNNGGD